ncbi:unnamed protein product [Owenia fusiformis]|uniref:Uncharacterized protein n=1 Tax=Owenia fusiformis TaxID=6347 RepID=A0A8J1URM8_OWEFU|nr:unnamed protein product [Owenia fusiformis]
MSLYPTLEDMKVDQMQQAQVQYQQAAQQPAVQYPGEAAQTYPTAAAAGGSSLYPSLQDYMGLSLSPECIAQNMPVVAANQNQQVAVPAYGRVTGAGQMQVAPVTGNDVGLRRAEIKDGIRFVQLCKDQSGMIGLRVRHVNKGLFVAFVHANSPASLAGVRFGDQILQINDQTVAGWDNDKAHKYLKKCEPQKITMAIRDRPFERTITMHKDSGGTIGFVFKNGKINSLVKDSSAARNGVLTEHHLVEVNGQNCVGLKDEDTRELIRSGPECITITIMPSFIYEHIIKCMGNSLVKKLMDHSIPDW